MDVIPNRKCCNVAGALCARCRADAAVLERAFSRNTGAPAPVTNCPPQTGRIPCLGERCPCRAVKAALRQAAEEDNVLPVAPEIDWKAVANASSGKGAREELERGRRRFFDEMAAEAMAFRDATMAAEAEDDAGDLMSRAHELPAPAWLGGAPGVTTNADGEVDEVLPLPHIDWGARTREGRR